MPARMVGRRARQQRWKTSSPARLLRNVRAASAAACVDIRDAADCVDQHRKHHCKGDTVIFRPSSMPRNSISGLARWLDRQRPGCFDATHKKRRSSRSGDAEQTSATPTALPITNPVSMRAISGQPARRAGRRTTCHPQTARRTLVKGGQLWLLTSPIRADIPGTTQLTRAPAPSRRSC